MLGENLPWLTEIGRSHIKIRLPVVLVLNELARILAVMEGEHRLFAELLYGASLRSTEGMRLRVKDVDFAHYSIIVREGT